MKTPVGSNSNIHDRISPESINRLEKSLADANAGFGHRLTYGRIARSPLTFALALLLVMNFILIATKPFAMVNPRSLPAVHTWTWWAAQEFFGITPAPNIVLLGSSLFMHPVSRADADYLNHELDYVKHHRSNLLEDMLKARFQLKQSPVCFNFAMPGDLVSDDYMILRMLLKDENKPDYIIIGLNLRDFIDNAVNCSGGTPPFRYLKRYGEIKDIVNLAFPNVWQHSDYDFGKICYLWQKKLDLQTLLDSEAKRVLQPIDRVISRGSLLNNLDYRHHVPANLHSEVEEGLAIVKPNIPNAFDGNPADYKRRCGNPNQQMYVIQTTFFDKLLTLAQERNIKVIVLNMPVTPENLKLMPPHLYQQYLNAISMEAALHGDTFVNLNGNPAFTHDDFYDTAHMNASGGRKLLTYIAHIPTLQLKDKH